MVTKGKIVPPLIVIIGETASGKSDLAIKLAKKFNGEIIAADSRTIYKDMDIGTAKPTSEDQKLIPHHLIDIIVPDKFFNVSDFKKLAQKAISNISSRGKIPLLVGGTGLYVDSLIFDYEFRFPAEPKQRKHLENLSVEDLQKEIINHGFSMPGNYKNPRHLIRTIETKGMVSKKHALRPNTLIIGLKIDNKDILESRIRERVDRMLDNGLVKEVEQLRAGYSLQAPPFHTPGYKAILSYVEGEITLEEAKERFIRSDMQLAKRQMTWFKRNKSVHWMSQQREIVELITTFLNN